MAQPGTTRENGRETYERCPFWDIVQIARPMDAAFSGQCNRLAERTSSTDRTLSWPTHAFALKRCGRDSTAGATAEIVRSYLAEIFPRQPLLSSWGVGQAGGKRNGNWNLLQRSAQAGGT